jgi:putative nucleotide binding protein
MSNVDSDEFPQETTREAVVLDFLAHGRSDDDRPQYQKDPLAYALGVDDFHLLECTIDGDATVTIGDRLVVDPAGERSAAIASVRAVEYDDLSGGAQSELAYVVEDVVEAQADRFVEFYTEAQPVTLRLHQLNLLPGIGDKLQESILDERRRGPFESFEDIEARVDGLHDAKQVIVDRVMQELTEDDLKYQVFVRRNE